MFSPFLIALAVFYYTLANISPQYRSSLKAIQLITVVKSMDVAMYGVDKILQPFMDDVAKLEKVVLCAPQGFKWLYIFTAIYTCTHLYIINYKLL